MSIASRYPAFARFTGIGAGLRPALIASTAVIPPANPQAAAETSPEGQEADPKVATPPAPAPKSETGEDENGDECDCEEDECDCDDEEMKGKTSEAAARIRENTRCAAIMAHPAAATNLAFASKLAFNTRLPRSEALALMDSAPAAAAATDLHSRMAPHAGRTPGPDASGEASTRAKHSEFWDGVRARREALTPSPARR